MGFYPNLRSKVLSGLQALRLHLEIGEHLSAKRHELGRNPAIKRR
jgi:hypothetical protein